MAKLYFKYGAMNSGKTTALLQVAHNYEERNMKVLILKPSIDTKGNDMVVSRLGLSRRVDFLISPEDSVKKFLENYREICDCIFVDEVQFLKENQVDELLEISVSWDIPVICYGIRTDFLMNGFEGSSRLLLIAHSIEEIKTTCRCKRKAIFNLRKINGEFVFHGEQCVIDGENNFTYESLCGKCSIEERDNYIKKSGCNM